MPTTPVDAYWREFFGLPDTAFDGGGCHVVAHQGLAGYDGAWLFQRGRTAIISVPQPLREDVLRGVGRDALPDPLDLDAWSHVFTRRIAKVIGPAYDGFLAADALPATPQTLPVRRLTPQDRPLLDVLRSSCTEEEWDHASIQFESEEPIFGCFVAESLVAAAQNKARGRTAVSPGVVTSTGWRRRGAGRAVLAAAMEDGLATGRLVLYQTLVSNRSAVRLGESLGIRQYALHHAYRFMPVGGEG